MNPRTDPTDPANMTPDERLAEVAAIFAEGILRLRRGAAGHTPKLVVIHPVESAEFAVNGLEVPLGTSPHGHRG
jgi:hypothetical protein